METQNALRTDKGEALTFTFDDGKCALYSSDLLHGTFAEAEELKETDSAERISSNST
jgi:hypothetical protein